jgi:cyclomaltodextrinase / maltogenic alpha-amylase / neopullulanase
MRRIRLLALAACATLLLLVLASTVTGPSRAVAAPDECMENPFGDRALYLRGGFSGWGALPEYQFVFNCNRFELQAQVNGPNEFKVADANWSANTDFGGGPDGNQVVEGVPLQLALRGSNLRFTFSGFHYIVLDVSQSITQPTLTIWQCQETPLGDALLGLSGTFNQWAPPGEHYFLYSCDAYYLNVNIQGTHEFKIGDPIGTPEENFGAADSENNEVILDVPFPLTSDAEAGGSAANLEFTFTGEHTLRLDFDEHGQPFLTITAQTWVNPGIPQPVTNPVARQVRFDSRVDTFKAPYGALPAPATVNFALEAPAGADAVTLVIETRRLEGNQEILEYLDPTRVPMTRTVAGDWDRWEASHQFETPNVYGYYFEIAIGDGLYVYQNNDAPVYWTLERGVGGAGQIVFLPENPASIRRYRQTVYSPDFEVPDWAPDIVYYYIFPERFRNGDPTNDPQPGVDTYLGGPIEFHDDWLEMPYMPGSGDGSDDVWNNDFFGGDLAGIIEKLDYLQDLGINTLYINPIFEAGSNHKYDTGDYLNVDNNFGTNEDFVLLATEGAARGIRVILDVSLNHSGSDSVYFDRYARFPGIGAFEAETIRPDSPWAEWYTFFPDAPNPDNRYRSWLGFHTLPEFNEVDSYKDFAFRAPDSVMLTWLDRGAAGWRMDVTPWVSDTFWREWRASIKAHRPDALLVAETWFDSSKYFLGDTYDSTMNYIFRNALYEFAAGAAAHEQYQQIEMMREAYPPQAFYALMNLLSTHDEERALYHFGYTDDNNPPEQIAEAKQRLRLAILFQMTFPGAPTIYYGDEVGLTGGRDPFNRRTYPWADKGGQPDEVLLEDVKALVALRNDNAVLRRGSLDAPLYLDDNVIALLRTHGNVTAITAYNNSTEAAAITVELPAGAGDNVYTDALTGEVFTPDNGMLTLTVPALFGRVLLSDEPTVISLSGIATGNTGRDLLPLALAGSMLLLTLGAMTWRRQRACKA